MVFALGFLVSGLLALAIAPAFWRRAIRLSTRRLEMLVPLSSREILAERDSLRAALAVEQRQLEQKAARLNAARAADLAELGRRTAQLVEKGNAFAALEKRHAEQTPVLAASRQALAEAEASLAATSSALYGAEGLVERKDAELMRAREEIAALQAQLARQRRALAEFEALVVMQQAHLSAARNEAAKLDEQLTTLGLEREATAATLKAVSARLAGREEALSFAQTKEAELLRRRKRQIETTRAMERRLLDRISRIGAEEATRREELEAARRQAAALAQEVTALRRQEPARLAAQEAAEREENALLRQNINEIGAAIIRMAGFALEASPGNERFDDGADKSARALHKANVAATSK